MDDQYDSLKGDAILPLAPLFGHKRAPMQRRPLQDTIKMTLSPAKVKIATLAPIRVHTHPQNPENMQPAGASRTNPAWQANSEQHAHGRLSLSLWQKLNLLHAAAPVCFSPPPQGLWLSARQAW
jgi:hypothetical protein